MDPTENRKIDVSKLSFIGLNTSELTWNDLHFGLQFPVEAPPGAAIDICWPVGDSSSL